VDPHLPYARVDVQERSRAWLAYVLAAVLVVFVAEFVVLVWLESDATTDWWMGVQTFVLIAGAVGMAAALVWRHRRRVRVRRAERRTTFVLLCVDLLVWGMLLQARLAMAAEVAAVRLRIGA
jgi:hypothetical protein